MPFANLFASSFYCRQFSMLHIDPHFHQDELTFAEDVLKYMSMYCIGVSICMYGKGNINKFNSIKIIMRINRLALPFRFLIFYDNIYQFLTIP